MSFFSRIAPYFLVGNLFTAGCWKQSYAFMEVGTTEGTLGGSHMPGPTWPEGSQPPGVGSVRMPCDGSKQCHGQSVFILRVGLFGGAEDKAVEIEDLELGWELLGVSGRKQRAQPAH